MSIKPLVAFHSNWRFKDFSFGFNMCSQKFYQQEVGMMTVEVTEGRESYLLICLGFWQVSLGVRII